VRARIIRRAWALIDTGLVCVCDRGSTSGTVAESIFTVDRVESLSQPGSESSDPSSDLGGDSISSSDVS
jgi:hypothetical protein